MVGVVDPFNCNVSLSHAAAACRSERKKSLTVSKESLMLPALQLQHQESRKMRMLHMLFLPCPARATPSSELLCC